MTDYRWVGPFRIEQLLADAVDEKLPKPPDSGSAYVVTRAAWKVAPTASDWPLYVGSNSGKSSRFRTRIGDLIADTFGFYGGGTGHHSGGQSIHKWCKENHFNPLQLHIGWIEDGGCHRCLEIDLFETLSPTLNRVKPSRCPKHGAKRGKTQ